MSLDVLSHKPTIIDVGIYIGFKFKIEKIGPKFRSATVASLALIMVRMDYSRNRFVIRAIGHAHRIHIQRRIPRPLGRAVRIRITADPHWTDILLYMQRRAAKRAAIAEHDFIAQRNRGRLNPRKLFHE